MKKAWLTTEKNKKIKKQKKIIKKGREKKKERKEEKKKDWGREKEVEIIKAYMQLRYKKKIERNPQQCPMR